MQTALIRALFGAGCIQNAGDGVRRERSGCGLWRSRARRCGPSPAGPSTVSGFDGEGRSGLRRGACPPVRCLQPGTVHHDGTGSFVIVGTYAGAHGSCTTPQSVDHSDRETPSTRYIRRNEWRSPPIAIDNFLVLVQQNGQALTSESAAKFDSHIPSRGAPDQ